MSRFVVSVRLPEEFNEEFVALIPAHRSFVHQLMEAGAVEVYAISADRSRGWITMNGTSTEAIQALIEQLPLYRFFEHVEIDELFLFDSVASRFPRLSLN